MSILIILSLILALLIGVVIHEYAHGKMAELVGDPTARLAGRLTLNPLPHLDPFASVILPLVLIVMGSPIVFAAAKPVPINPMYFRHGRRDLLLVGAAGPFSNFALAGLAGISTSFIWGFLPEILQIFIIILVKINVILAVFNLIPVPPLDGSRILEGILPASHLRWFYALERFGILILFFFLIVFNRLFWAIFSPLLNFFTRLFLPRGF